jgi:hypothetical protein
MKNLNEYIKESLLDDFDELDKDVQQNAIKTNVLKFLIDNYILNSKPINPDDKKIKIGDSPNKDGKYVVDVDGNVDVKNFNIYTLTNDLFVFGKVGGYFSCTDCKNLTSLEGAPKEVGGGFFCTDINLTSLEGAPKEVGGGFFCSRCHNLISLKGAPEKVGLCFHCTECKNLTSLKGSPKKVGGNFYCTNCNNLTSLEGAPKEVEEDFNCYGCNKLKNLNHLPKKIKGLLDIPDHLKNN